MRKLALTLLGFTVSAFIGGCYVREHRECRNGWEPEHRDRDGHVFGGHCR